MSKTSCVWYHCQPCQVHERDAEEAPRIPLLCTSLFLYILLEVPLGGLPYLPQYLGCEGTQSCRDLACAGDFLTSQKYSVSAFDVRRFGSSCSWSFAPEDPSVWRLVDLVQ